MTKSLSIQSFSFQKKHPEPSNLDERLMTIISLPLTATSFFPLPALP
jgi:hypothetical protein